MNTNRYQKQIALKSFGQEAQNKLNDARVLVVGAGGLGCPVLQVLSSVGVGAIGIVDGDEIDFTNLHRQFLYREGDVGRKKVVAAKEYLNQRNSKSKIEVYPEFLDKSNVFELVSAYDLVVDGTDNFSVRYLLNDATHLLEKPLVYGALYFFEGQVSVFNVLQDGELTNYRDLFPHPPGADEVPNCNVAGVLPTLTSWIGTLQAQEVIKIITGIAAPLVHRLLLVDSLTYDTKIIRYRKNPDAHQLTSKEDIFNYNYNKNNCLMNNEQNINDTNELKEFIKEGKSTIVDVRARDEMPRIDAHAYPVLDIPLGELSARLEELAPYDKICFSCASGVRSLKALDFVQNVYPEKELKNLSRGIKTFL